MSEELMQLGEVFKTRRKEMNLSLKEIENSTSIRGSYLAAIEEGKAEEFLSSVYLIGFVRQYATFLGLEVEELVKTYPNVFRTKNEKHDFAYGIGTLEVRGSMGGGVKWLPNLLWAGASAVILVMAYFLAKYLGVI